MKKIMLFLLCNSIHPMHHAHHEQISVSPGAEGQIIIQMDTNDTISRQSPIGKPPEPPKERCSLKLKVALISSVALVVSNTLTAVITMKSMSCNP